MSGMDYKLKISTVALATWKRPKNLGIVSAIGGSVRENCCQTVRHNLWSIDLSPLLSPVVEMA